MMHRTVDSAQTKRTRGASIIEFALVLPLLLLVVFGIIEFSVALYDKAVITNASREAARAGAIFRTPALKDAEIAQVAVDATKSLLITLNGTAAAEATVSRPAGGTAGNPLTVTVTYQFTGLLLGSLVSVMGGTQTLTSSTTMLIE